MMLCKKHEFVPLGDLDTQAIIFIALWDIALLAIVFYTIAKFQFYLIALLLFFASTLKSNKNIYCKKCGLTKKERDRGIMSNCEDSDKT